MPSILGASASGLQHYSRQLDAIAHNIANVNTDGFKMVRSLAEGAPAITAEGEGRLGVAQTTLDRLFDVGQFRATGDPLEFAIQDHDVFLPVSDFDGRTIYTRVGQLGFDPAGNIASAAGRPLVPPVKVPLDLTQPSINADGTISAIDAGGNAQIVGRVALVRFPNPGGLEALGEGMYGETLNSGIAQGGYPGEGGFAPIIAGAIEGSNVELPVEFTKMIVAQRAYQAAARTLSAAAEMLEMATQPGV